MTELTAFTSQLLRRPRQVSALAPSSQRLCRLMTDQIPLSASRVAEFGPGTGNATREILDLGILPGNLYLFEINPIFCQMLRKRYSGVTVFGEPAENVASLGCGGIDAIVSGLPLLSMSAAQQREILSAAFSTLTPDGVYIQFTYGPFPPVRASVAELLGLEWVRTRRIWGNLPPAMVYVYRRTRKRISA